MEWFRYYVNTLDKYKIQSLPPVEFKEWVNLLCVARKHGGTLPGVDQIAWCLHTTSARAAGMLERAISRKLFDRDADGTVRPHDWDEWQRASDDAAQRKRDQRERDRDRAVSRDVSQKKSQDASQIRPVLEQNRHRTDTEQRQNRTDDNRPDRAGEALIADCPLTAAAVREHFATADPPAIAAVFHAGVQALADLDFAGPADLAVAKAVHTARAESPKQRSVMLFRTTVPAVLRSWGTTEARDGE